ncbi:ComF family protein [Peterkaempfera bronchialis]|uniref:ComF family protein n=1 Tax=Peterkaempfera bronchialis TaxID=2126346 RepID=UPI003C2F69FD
MDPAAAPRPARPLDALLDLLLPGRCAGCGSDGGQLCTRCRAALETAPGHPVRPDPPPPGLPPVYAATEYAGPVRGLLLAHKERGALRLADPLGRALATAVHAAAADGLTGRAPIPLLLVPVPSARRAVRARGHDPVHRLARVAARELRRAGVPGRAAAVLRPVRPVADQAGLGAADRRRNLAGALAVRPGAAAGPRPRSRRRAGTGGSHRRRHRPPDRQDRPPGPNPHGPKPPGPKPHRPCPQRPCPPPVVGARVVGSRGAAQPG